MSDSNMYDQLISKAHSGRSNYDTYWQEVADYFIPRDDFTISDRSPAQNRRVELYDNLGTECVENLSAALSSMLTPEVTQWAKQIPSKRVSSSSIIYLDRTNEAIFRALGNPSRRFHQSLSECYLDLVAYGNACLYIGTSDSDFYFRSIPLQDVYIKESYGGKIDTVIRKMKMTVRQLRQQFDDSDLSSNVVNEKDADKQVNVVHICQPRKDHYGKGARSNKKPIASVYYDCDNKHVISEGGYDTFPYVYLRFHKRTGEVYGYGPGMTALSTIKMRNKIKEIMIRGGAKAVDPVLLSPHEGLIGQNRIDPGDVLFYDPTVNAPQPLNTNYRPDYFEYLLVNSEQSVRRMFYTEWINLPQQPNMTATEVIERTNQSLRMLQPLLARIHADLTQIYERVRTIMLDQERIDRLPSDLKEEDIMIEFVSPIDQAQRMQASNNVLQGIGFTTQLAQFEAGITDAIDFEQVMMDNLISNYNWKSEYFADDEAVAAKREARSMQNSMESALAGSEIAGNAAAAVKDLSGA